jgi:ribosomal protein S8E
MLQHEHMERPTVALTTSGKVAWGMMAQVTNANAFLLGLD